MTPPTEVVATSPNAVGNPCATTEEFAQSLGLTPEQIESLESIEVAH